MVAEDSTPEAAAEADTHTGQGSRRRGKGRVGVAAAVARDQAEARTPGKAQTTREQVRIREAVVAYRGGEEE